jgi:hypothetical protein
MLRLCLLIQVLLITCARSEVYNFDNWPKHCCRLKLQKHTIGAKLPDDAILVSDDKTGIEWGFALPYPDRQKGSPLIIANNRNIPPLQVRKSALLFVNGATRALQFDCDSSDTEFVLLITNPFRCSLGWQKVIYPDQPLYDDENLSSDGRKFRSSFVSDDKIVFIGKQGTSPGFYISARQGRFDHCNGTPARPNNAQRSSQSSSPVATDVLYVNRLNSLLRFTATSSAVFSANDSDISYLTPKDEVNFQQTYYSKSPSVPLEETVHVSFKKRETSRVTTSSLLRRKTCFEQKARALSEFKSEFSSKDTIGLGIEATAGASGLVFHASVKMSANYEHVMTSSSMNAITKAFENSHESCDTSAVEKEAMEEVVEETEFRREMRYMIPPLKKLIVTAKTSRLTGDLPFKIQRQ